MKHAPPLQHRDSTQFRPMIAPNLEAWYDVSAVENSGNYLARSEEFSLVWNRIRLNAFGAIDTGVAAAGSFSDTAQTLDPIGRNTADFIQEDPTATSTHFLQNTGNMNLPISGVEYSIYVKTAGRTIVWLNVDDGTNAIRGYFNLTPLTTQGAATQGAGNGVVLSISDAGNGWRKCTLTGNPGAVTGIYKAAIYLAVAGPAISYSGDNTQGVYLWGAQIRLTSWDTRYIPTGANPIFPNAQADAALAVVNLRNLAPLFDDRANLLVQSDMFSTTWVRTRLNAFGAVDTGAAGAGSFANTTRTTDPLSGNFADFVQEDATAANTHLISQSIVLASGTYTFSCFVKASGRNWVRLIVGVVDSIACYFNVTAGAGAVGTAANGGGASGAVGSIVDIGNGWFRCVLTGVLSVSGTYAVDARLATGDGGSSYNGDNTSGLFLWGAQLRRSTWSDQYIRTTTDTVTPFRNGSFRDLYQGTGSAQPLLVLDSVNRKPVLQFNGTTHFLKTPIFTLQQPCTVYMAYRPLAITAFARFFDGNSSNSMGAYQTGANRIALSAGTDLTLTDAYDIALTKMTIGAFIFVLGDGSTADIETDRSYVGSTIGVGAAFGITLGARGNNANFSNIEFSEMLVFSVQHDRNTRRRIMKYLADKWASFVV